MNATLITGNTIEFSGISTALNALGSMEDNQIKEYRLEIQLKSNIDGTIAGATKETIDNTRFEFWSMPLQLHLRAGIISV